jgi:hypothetical protein
MIYNEYLVSFSDCWKFFIPSKFYGHARSIAARRFALSRGNKTLHDNGEPLLITNEKKEDWDSLWKEQDKKFIADCQLERTFEWMIKSKFAVADGNH